VLVRCSMRNHRLCCGLLAKLWARWVAVGGPSSWLNRIEAQFTALRYFALDGTDHQTHDEQASMIRRYIAWRNRHTGNSRLRRIVERANVA
jgi:hypothetical protein